MERVGKDAFTLSLYHITFLPIDTCIIFSCCPEKYLRPIEQLRKLFRRFVPSIEVAIALFPLSQKLSKLS
jgi:hypothetical protein